MRLFGKKRPETVAQEVIQEQPDSLDALFAELHNPESWHWKIDVSTGRFLHKRHPQNAEELHISAALERMGKDDRYRVLKLLETLDHTWSAMAEGTLEKQASHSVAKVLRRYRYDTYKYLGVLETYGVSWTLEKAARDTLQNFFDGSGGTLDMIEMSTSTSGGEYAIHIQNHAMYDFRLLMHLGGTTKQDDLTAAGGFGEGTKVLALVLLRDYGFTQVRFCSHDWQLDFVLDELPEGEYVKDVRGLYAGLMHRQIAFNGNYIEFRTPNKESIGAFVQARLLFYSSDNPDFKDPTVEVPGVGGFKVLPLKESTLTLDKSSKGNFYYVGQRRHYEKEEWNTVENLHLWTWKNDVLEKDRDRGKVTRYEMRHKVLPAIVQAASVEDLKRSIRESEHLWQYFASFFTHANVGYMLFDAIIERLSKLDVKLEFDEKYLAIDVSSQPILEALKAKGYKLCAGMYKKIGMKGVSTLFREMTMHFSTPPTQEELKRVDILYEGIGPMGKEKKEIFLFEDANKKNIVHGQYEEGTVWIARETLRLPFEEALGIYLHELDHEHGTDISAEFSYALTATMKIIIKAVMRHTAKFHALEARWNASLEDEKGAGMNPS